MIYILVWNVLVFLLYGWDKLMAVRKGWRIPEFWLLITALLSGGAGALCGMVIFNHKTKKWMFRLIIPLALAITLAVIHILDIYML